MRAFLVEGSGSSGDNSRSGKQRGCGRGTTASNHDMTKVKCFKCNIYEHYSKECRKPLRERREAVNLTQVQDNAPALLLTKHCELNQVVVNVLQTIFLHEEKVFRVYNSSNV